MNMPNVTKCNARDCSYNMNDACHALAVTIGDGTHPRCDTYVHMALHGGDAAAVAKVGACKVAACKFNQSLECSAPTIAINTHGKCPDCSTFEQS